MQFIENLSKEDDKFILALMTRFSDVTDNFLQEMHKNDQEYVRLEENKRREISDLQRIVEEELQSRIRNIYEVEALSMRGETANDLSTELAIEFSISQSEERKKLFEKCLKFISEIDDEIRRLSKEYDKEFLLVLKQSDIKFRALLWARMNSLVPISHALREAQISDRNEQRRLRVEQHLVSKKKLNIMAWESNKKDLALEIKL